MYSQKEKKKAVDLYIKYDKQLSKTVETLGYPSHNSLRKCYYEFRDSGEVKITYTRKQKYTEEQKDKAMRHYFEHGTNVTNTIAALGYPCRPILKAWIDDKFPNQKKDCSYQKQLVEYTHEQKELALKELLIRERTAKKIADDIGVDRVTLYNWKNQYLGKEATTKVKPILDLPNDKESLEAEVNRLKVQIHRFELEKDILEKTTDIIKKDPGINPEKLTNKEKTEVIDALKNKYKLKELLHFLQLPKSSYFYQKSLLGKEDKYTELIKNITEFHIPAGKIYLSPIIDCFDGTVVSWTIGTAPNADLVNTMLDNAIVTLKSGVHPIIHSDRGAHYRWPGWIKRMNDAKLIRSMSRKGCSPDNSACEGFFGRLKNEMFYSNSWLDVTIDSFIIYKG